MLGNYNRIYDGMFNGSLYGAGAVRIAVWAYVLSRMKPSRADGEFYVELNTRLLADCLGEKESEVAEALDFLRSPDPNSRSHEDGGRRLKPVGQFLHLVVNGRQYQQFEFAEKRRQQWRESKAVQRARQKGGGVKLKPGQSLKQYVQEKVAPEVAADLERLNQSPAVTGEPGGKMPTESEFQKFLMEHPEVKDKSLGVGMGPPIGPNDEAESVAAAIRQAVKGEA